MTKHDGERGLNERHILLAELLVSGVSITDAAASVGLSRQRVSDLIRKSPRFKAELETRRHEAAQELRDKLRETVLTAANESVKLLKNDDVSPVARLQVAVSLLGKLEKYFTSDTREPRDAERIAENMSSKTLLDGFLNVNVNETMKRNYLEGDLVELKEDQNNGAE